MMDQPPVVTDVRHEEVGGTEVPGRAGYAAAPATAGYTRTTAVAYDPAWRAIQLVWFLEGLAEFIVGLRVIFKAIAANADAGFVRFIYDISTPLVAPFRPIVSDYRLGNGGVLEISSLIAMLVFLVLTYLVVRLVRALSAPRAARPVA